MTDTPLSDLIAGYRASRSAEIWGRFLDTFRMARLGVIATGGTADATDGFVSTDEHPISVGMTEDADGRPLVLAFADPVAFTERFGVQFNAEISGEAILGTVLSNRECQGVLVNSALAEMSII